MYLIQNVFTIDMELKNLPLVCCLLVLCLGLLMTPCKCITSCKPAEEGTDHQINCTRPSGVSSSNMFNVEWRMVNEYNTSELVAECFSETDCNVLRPSNVRVSFEGDTSTLTIMNVSRTRPFNVETSWTCGWRGNNTITVCAPLQVFEKPTNVRCEYAKVSSRYVKDVSSINLQFRCTTDKIYPEARCEILHSSDPSDSDWKAEFHSTRYNHTVISRDPVYYTSECAINFRWRYAEYDGPYLKVLMYPLNGGREYGRHSEIWNVVLEKFKEGDKTVTTTVEPSAKPKDSDDDTTTTNDNNNDDEKMTLPLALGLGIPLAIMSVVAIVMAVLLCRNMSTSEPTRKSKDPPMRNLGPMPETYDHMELSNQRQESVSAGHYYHDAQGQDGQSQRNLDSRRQEDPNVESFYVNEAVDSARDSNVYEN